MPRFHRCIQIAFVIGLTLILPFSTSSYGGKGGGGGKPGGENENVNYAFLFQNEEGLFLTTIDATKTLQVTRSRQGDTPASWSPDLSPETPEYVGQIAFLERARNGSDLYVINPDGSGKRLVQSYDLYSEPADNDAGKTTLAWSPNGREILFASSQDIMYAVDVATGNTRVLFLGPGYYGNSNQLSNPTVSALGMISFSYQGAVYIVNFFLDESGHMQVGDSPEFAPITDTSTTDDVAYDRPSWSPDGTYLAFIKRDFGAVGGPWGELVVYDALFNEFITVWESADLAYAEITWSPDGAHVAFHSYSTQTTGGNSDSDILILYDWDDPIQRRLVNTSLTPDQFEEFPEWNPGWIEL